MGRAVVREKGVVSEIECATPLSDYIFSKRSCSSLKIDCYFKG